MQLSLAAISLVVGYILGSMVWAYILGRVFRNVDIRHHGNKNPGTLNSIATLGWPLTVAVFLGDAGKGVLSVLIVRLAFGWSPEFGQIAAVGAILGHCFPFWMRFRGGKGTATAIGTLAALDWRIAIPFCILLVSLAFLINKSVAGSFTAYASMPIGFALLGHPAVEVLLAGGTAVLLTAIQVPLLLRTIRGTQPTISKSVFRR